jgi:hypothetical protein
MISISMHGIALLEASQIKPQRFTLSPYLSFVKQNVGSCRVCRHAYDFCSKLICGALLHRLLSLSKRKQIQISRGGHVVIINSTYRQS